MQEEGESGAPQLRTDLGLFSALSIVVGMVLGAGAFMKPPAVMAAAGDSTWALTAWVIGALLSMAGGLTLCELGVLFPRTGGVYVFLEEIYGAKVSYLYGWTLIFIFGPATIGALAGYFSSVFCLLFGIPEQYTAVVGFAAMAFVLFLHSRTGPVFGGIRIPKKYFILTGSAIVIGLLMLSTRVIDTRPVLKVAVEASNPPIAFEDDGGRVAGLDIDIIEAVGRNMGYRVSIRPTAFKHLLVSVEKGLADVAVGELSVTEGRKRTVAFSDGYHESDWPSSCRWTAPPGPSRTFGERPSA